MSTKSQHCLLSIYNWLSEFAATILAELLLYRGIPRYCGISNDGILTIILTNSAKKAILWRAFADKTSVYFNVAAQKLDW